MQMRFVPTCPAFIDGAFPREPVMSAASRGPVFRIFKIAGRYSEKGRDARRQPIPCLKVQT